MSRNLSILLRYLSWFVLFLLVCLVGKLNVFADTFENIGYLNNFSEVNVEVSYTGSPLPLTRTNTYQLQDVEALNIQISNYSFTGDKTYSIELYTPNTTLQYANAYTATGFGSNNTSYICSVFDITSTDAHYPNFRFKCPANINSIYIRVYNTSGNNIMPTGIFAWNYVYLRSVITEDNTQDIINNQIQNTQDIINNQNQNTQDIIDANKSCSTIDEKNIDIDNKSLSTTGDLTNNNNFGITNYINIHNVLSITARTGSVYGSASYCFYDSTKTIISCSAINVSDGLELTIPSNSYYFRSSIDKRVNKPIYDVCFNGNQANNNALNDLKDALTDDSPIDVSSLGDTLGWLPPGPIDSIINLPLNLFNSLTTALSGNCSPLSVPLPYVNKTMTIPCINTLFEQMGFTTFWNWVGTIASIVMLYHYLLNLYQYYDDLTTLKANFISDFGGAP